jgi:hypothetical protein
MEAIQDYSKGFKCEHCGSYVKEYRRSLNSNMAVAMLALYLNGKENSFIKVEEFLIKNGYPRCGDFSYLRFYGFLEPLKEKREDGSSRNGYYRLTAIGRLFVEGKVLAFEKFKILHNTFTGFEGNEISIKQALKEKFDYDALMGNNGNNFKTDNERRQISKHSKLQKDIPANNLFTI